MDSQYASFWYLITIRPFLSTHWANSEDTQKSIFLLLGPLRGGGGKTPWATEKKRKYLYDLKEMPRTSSTKEKMTKTADDVEMAVLTAS